MGGADEDVEVALYTHGVTPRSIIVSKTGDHRSGTEFLPKQYVRYEWSPNQPITVTMPRWLAEKKGLL